MRAVSDLHRDLQQAARERFRLRLRPEGGTWLGGVLVRPERDDLVASVPGHGLRGGENVRLWIDVPGAPLHVRAAVLRTRVPVPDRGPAGLLLGLLAPAQEPVGDHGLELAVCPPTGGRLSLLEPPVKWVQVGARTLIFSVPFGFGLQFVQRGQLRLSMAAPGLPAYQVLARVDRLVPGEGVLLYEMSIEGVEAPERHLRVTQQLSRALESA